MQLIFWSYNIAMFHFGIAHNKNHFANVALCKSRVCFKEYKNWNNIYIYIYAHEQIENDSKLI